MNNLLRGAKVYLTRNAPTILTYVGAAGVVATSILAIKATPKALRLLEEAKEEKGEELTKLESIKTVAPTYIPTIVMGASTIACIFGVNVLNKRQQAALISAYTMLNTRFKDYEDKVKEVYGEEGEANVKNELVKDSYKDSNISVEEDEELFYDLFSERYFKSTIQHVKDAEYNFNRNLALRGFADLNELYDFYCIPEVSYGFSMGWNLAAEGDYGYRWVDLHHSKITMDDGQECWVISMPFEPHIDYMDY